MAKILVIPNDRDMLDIDCDGLILGIKDLSINMPFYLELDELKKIPKDKEIFISLNKNIHNNDLEKLKYTLLELNKLNIKAVIYYDISIVNLYNKLDLNYDLVWNQEHLATNYLTSDYWFSKNVKYTYLSQEITINEIEEIIEKTKSKLMVNMFGYIPMYTSKRHGVKNYYDYFKIKDDSKINYIEKEGKTYPIIDSKNGTTVYSDSVLNGIKEYNQIKEKIDYVILNSFLIEKEIFEKILRMYKTVNKEKEEEYFNEINNILSITSTYFLHKATIYKVI